MEEIDIGRIASATEDDRDRQPFSGCSPVAGAGIIPHSGPESNFASESESSSADKCEEIKRPTTRKGGRLKRKPEIFNSLNSIIPIPDAEQRQRLPWPDDYLEVPQETPKRKKPPRHESRIIRGRSVPSNKLTPKTAPLGVYWVIDGRQNKGMQHGKEPLSQAEQIALQEVLHKVVRTPLDKVPDKAISEIVDKLRLPPNHRESQEVNLLCYFKLHTAKVAPCDGDFFQTVFARWYGRLILFSTKVDSKTRFERSEDGELKRIWSACSATRWSIAVDNLRTDLNHNGYTICALVGAPVLTRTYPVGARNGRCLVMIYKFGENGKEIWVKDFSPTANSVPKKIYNMACALKVHEVKYWPGTAVEARGSSLLHGYRFVAKVLEGDVDWKVPYVVFTRRNTSWYKEAPRNVSTNANLPPGACGGSGSLEPDSGSFNPSLACPTCGKIFGIEQALIVHQQKHPAPIHTPSQESEVVIKTEIEEGPIFSSNSWNQVLKLEPNDPVSTKPPHQPIKDEVDEVIL